MEVIKFKRLGDSRAYVGLSEIPFDDGDDLSGSYVRLDEVEEKLSEAYSQGMARSSYLSLSEINRTWVGPIPPDFEDWFKQQLEESNE